MATKHYAIVSYLWHLNCDKALKQTRMRKLMMVAAIALLASCSPKVGEGVAQANSNNNYSTGNSLMTNTANTESGAATTQSKNTAIEIKAKDVADPSKVTSVEAGK